jgi:hypothetical protein
MKKFHNVNETLGFLKITILTLCTHILECYLIRKAIKEESEIILIFLYLMFLDVNKAFH